MENRTVIMKCERCGFSMEQENTLFDRITKKSSFQKVLGKQLCSECYGKYIKSFINFMEELNANK